MKEQLNSIKNIKFLFGDLYGEGEAEKNLDDKTGFYDMSIWKSLYDFQKDGVRGAINKILKHNGCVVADSVGFGKPYEALAIIKYFELLNLRVLVLCPKKLSGNWTVYQASQNHILKPFPQDRFEYSVPYHTDLGLDSGFFKLLDEFTIARSRKHIKSLYDLSLIGSFPAREKPISVYPGIDRENRFPISILNSRLIDAYFGTLPMEIQDNTKRFIKKYVEQIPVPSIPDADTLEEVVDLMVYGLYFPEDMKAAGCFVNDLITETALPFAEGATKEEKTARVKEYAAFCREHAAVKKALAECGKMAVMRTVREDNDI